MTTERIPFEQALKQLEAIVAKLQDAQTPLEEAVSLYEEGIRLSNYCAEILDEARLKIEQVNPNPSP